MPRHHDRCSGHCCESFTLPIGPEALELSYRRWLGDGESLQMNGDPGGPRYQDIHLIYPMVTYIGYNAEGPELVNPTDDEILGRPRPKEHRYRCKHLDPATRDCTIYDIRPEMCRSYPNGGSCDYANCTWDKVKAEPDTPEERERRKAALTPLENEITLPEVEPKESTKTEVTGPCADCGIRVPVNTMVKCMACGAHLCQPCWTYGHDCQRDARKVCCEVCGVAVPPADIKACVDCGKQVCADCWASGCWGMDVRCNDCARNNKGLR